MLGGRPEGVAAHAAARGPRASPAPATAPAPSSSRRVRRSRRPSPLPAMMNSCLPMMFQTLKATADGAVGELLLNRPDKLNALSRELLGELIDAAAWFDDQDSVKVVVVRGAGRAFSAGADIGSIGQAGGEGDETRRRHAMDLGRRMA